MEIGEGWKWIVGTLIAVLTLLSGALGLNKLLEMHTARRYALEDKNSDIHLSNQTKQIDLDQFAFKTFADRLEKVESELQAVRKELSSQMANNARLEVENQHLKETNERQQTEIVDLRDRERILNDQINSLPS